MLNPENLSNNIRHDLHDARALLEHAGTEEEKKKYRKAAEIILLKALRQDPENTEAQMLLQSARALPVSSSYLAPQRPAQRAAQPAKQEEPPFIAAGPLFESLQPEKRKKRKPNVLFGLIATVACGGGILWLLQSHRTTTNALAAPVPAAAPMPAPVPVAQPVVEAAPPPIETTALVTTQPAPAAQPTAPSVLPAAGTAVITPAAPGRLAVSSPVPAEIYEGSRHLGSTPTTVELPAGRHSLEYRHGDLRTAANYDIKSSETATASITFQTTIQINAKPWAQVYLDGASRRQLGQTPLSGVSVPLGGVLVFENPNFTTQSRRITESDTAIQVDFQ